LLYQLSPEPIYLEDGAFRGSASVTLVYKFKKIEITDGRLAVPSRKMKKFKEKNVWSDIDFQKVKQE
jgi:hypothetical protein